MPAWEEERAEYLHDSTLSDVLRDHEDEAISICGKW
jgi:hypothetical protein